jgi:hypothetical protein
MKSVPHTEPRLRLKPAEPTTGHVDGAWWPRSRDLPAELPALLATLSARLGGIERVTYRTGAWPPARRLLTLGDAVVHLEGFRTEHADTLTVAGYRNRYRVTLLVVPPETDPGRAYDILTAAALPDNIDDVETLLGTIDPAA